MNDLTDARAIVEALRSKGTRSRKDFTETYHPSTIEVLGVSAPNMRAVLRDVRRTTISWPTEDVVALAFDIIAQSTHEGRQLAYELIAAHKGALERLKLKDIEALGEGIDNWAAVDGFATTIPGPAWRMGLISDAAVKRWARSRDKWWRRTALVSTVPLNVRSRGGHGDAERTLMTCEMLVVDNDDMIAKAMSWALRELVTHDPRAVEAFLDHHEDRLARRVLREVRNKLATGLKNPKRTVRTR